MIIKVLGSAAGGGFPQWNCNTRLSRLGWDAADGVEVRSQSSIAVSGDGLNWTVINASPDIRQQIANTVELQPDENGALRNSPIKAVILTNGDVDHVAGLLSLRERQAFSLYATGRVLAVIRSNSIFNVLADDVVTRTSMDVDQVFSPIASDGVTVTPFDVPGKVALYLEDAGKGPGFGTQAGDTIGLQISASSSDKVFYIPGCASIDDRLLARVQGASLLLLDGTVFTDTELADTGVGEKTGRRMGHVPISGEGGSIHAFDGCDIKQKVYIHINTTNPILEPGSPAETAVRVAGWDIAYDGMTFEI